MADIKIPLNMLGETEFNGNERTTVSLRYDEITHSSTYGVDLISPAGVLLARLNLTLESNRRDVEVSVTTPFDNGAELRIVAHAENGTLIANKVLPTRSVKVMVRQPKIATI